MPALVTVVVTRRVRDLLFAAIALVDRSCLGMPLAKPTRPLYVSGPNDDVDRILDRPNERVGPGNFEFLAGNGEFGPLSNSE